MSNIKLFESKKIRSHWDAEAEKWYFSVIDVIEALTGSPRPRKYWNALKTKLKTEGSELSHNLGQLKLQSEDGKFYKTDVADTEQLLRLIQSVPSPKAEPFKQWLAQTGYERIEETQDPEKSIDRAMENYLKLGYSKEWINQRLKSIEVRKELTDEWENRGVKKGQEFATLTDIITQAWSGNTVKQYKRHKGLKKENLRDNMTNLELVLNMLAKATTTEISKEKKPKNFDENKTIARQGAQ
jgi:BRO family, N-terminal domain